MILASMKQEHLKFCVNQIRGTTGDISMNQMRGTTNICGLQKEAMKENKYYWCQTTDTRVKQMYQYQTID